MLNTVIFAVATTVIMVIVSTLAAYAFARLNFRGKNLVFTLFLSLMMIPSELVVITNFVTVTNLDLRNTFVGLVLPSVTSVFYIYLLKENFEQVPDELYRAAKVDGTSDLKYFVESHDPYLPAHHYYYHHFKDHRMLELLCVAPLITDNPAYYLVSNGIQEIRENGFGRENIPAMMAAVVVISVPTDRSVFNFPQKDHGRGYPREVQKDEAFYKKHLGPWPTKKIRSCRSRPSGGRRHVRMSRTEEQTAFEVPQEFDMSRNYELTFWAKNDTNVRQTEIYKQAIADFEAFYPNISIELRLYTDYGDIYNDVITNISTNTTPNVCITYRITSPLI